MTDYLEIAMDEARAAATRDEVPIGAVLVDPATGKIIAQNGNRTRELNDPTAHAEILVIRDACRIVGAQRIPDLDLYVTLEPCMMCAAALSFARIKNIIYGAKDIKGGGLHFFDLPICHHHPVINGPINDTVYGQILKDFFALKRTTKDTHDNEG